MSKQVVIIRCAAGPALNFARGGLATVAAADAVRQMGRGDDTILLHVNPEEMRELKGRWGAPTVNPHTGLPEYGLLKKAFKKIKHVAKKVGNVAKKIIKSPVFQAVLPVALNFVAPGLGATIGGALGATGTAASVIGNAALQGGVGALTGGKKGALAGALAGGVGAGVAGKGALSKMAANSLAGGVGSKIRGGKFATGALSAGAASGIGSLMRGEKFLPGSDGVKTDLDSASYNNNEVKGWSESLPDDYGDAIGAMDMPPEIDPNDFIPQAPEYSLGAKAGSYFDTMKGRAVDFAKEHPVKTAMGALTLINGMSQKRPKPPQMSGGEYGTGTPLQSIAFNRQQTMPEQNYYTYGQMPEQVWFQGNQMPPNQEQLQQEQDNDPYASTSAYAEGGYTHGGGALSNALSARPVYGEGDGRDDLIDAKLSDGEYVMDAETVAMLGNGSSKAGALALDKFREEIRRHKGQALSRGKFSPGAKSPMQYLKAQSKGKKRGAK